MAADEQQPKRASAAGRQAGDYQPPILAKPKGGPVPTGKVSRAGAHHDDDELHHYWTRDPEGRGKWVESPTPWTTLVEHLSPKVGPERAKVYASRWFIEVFGYAAGSDKNRVAHGHPPRGKKVGPG